jgi:hypothetical protein
MEVSSGTLPYESGNLGLLRIRTELQKLFQTYSTL